MMQSSSPLPILVVDDDAVSRMVLVGILKRLPGVDVIEAADGLEAWERLEQGLRPVICCTDVHMPRLDGLGLVRKAKAHPILRFMTVVMIAGEPDRDTVRRAREQGVAGFIVKPFSAADARAAVERILREALASRAEEPCVTRSRLNVDAATLSSMLALLREDVESTREQVAAGRPVHERESHALRLAGACKTLGIMRAAALLGGVRGLQVPTADVLLVFDEVVDMVRSQQGRASGSPAEVRRVA